MMLYPLNTIIYQLNGNDLDVFQIYQNLVNRCGYVRNVGLCEKDETRFKFKFNLDNTLYGVVATIKDGLSHLKC